MLNNEAIKNIALIDFTAKQVFGEACEFGEMKICKVPHSEFSVPMRIYGRACFELYYDRGRIGLWVYLGDERVVMDKLTSRYVYGSFESAEPANLLHNLRVLDEVARELIARGEI
jgi:hypothetical protein